MTQDNMRIWSAVEKTDPDHTKKVNQRGGFTAISASYQVLTATKQFGPIGIGWGYDAGAPIFQGDFVIIPVTLWHGDRSNTFGPVYGTCEMFGKRPDSDAPKKAGTDALTKLLAQLGFNADVFLGKFDDNKYVAELEREKAAENKPAPSDVRDRLKAAIAKKADATALEGWWKNDAVSQAFSGLPEPMQGEVQKAYTDRMAEVFQAPPSDDAMQDGHQYQ